MTQGITVCLTGTQAVDVAKMLAVRLIEMGRYAEHLDDATMRPFGTQKAAAHACDLLARNGVVAIMTQPRLKTAGPRLDIAIEEHDTPDFATEKVIDELANAGAVALESADYSPEEEEQIRKRLADLGYIE